jgi:hypothetical protein
LRCRSAVEIPRSASISGQNGFGSLPKSNQEERVVGGRFLKRILVGIRLTQVSPICSVWGWWKSIHVI